MKRILLILLFFLKVTLGSSQGFNIDSLKNELNKATEDTTRVLLLAQIAEVYIRFDRDTGLLYALRGYNLAQKINYKKGEHFCITRLARCWWSVGDFATALKLLLPKTKEIEATGDHYLIGYANGAIADSYRDQGEFDLALVYHFKGEKLQSKDCSGCWVFNAAIASDYLGKKMWDSAQYYINKAFAYTPMPGLEGWPLYIRGNTYAELQKYDSAFFYYRQSIPKLLKEYNLKDLANVFNSMAAIFNSLGLRDSALFYANKALATALPKRFAKEAMEANLLLSQIFERRNTDSALHYYKQAIVAKDSLYNQEKQRQILSYQFNEQLQQQEIRNAEAQLKARIKFYLSLVTVGIFLIIALILWRSNLHKQRAYALLQQQKEKIDKQKREAEIETALERVRTVAMGMKAPADMLEVCSTISHQLEALNVKEIRNVQTAIFYEGKGTYMNYEYYAKHDKTIITETTYTNNQLHNTFANQMLKGNGEFFVTHIKGNEVKDWIEYQKSSNVFIDDYLYTASSLNYYWYSLGTVALGISTYAPLQEEDVRLFKRFLKVFELSYTRYTDIEQAQAQARESQIQLALERVRARTMAMQKSEELTDVAALLFKQVHELGIKMWTTGFNVWSDDNNSYTDYVTDPKGGFMQPYTVDTSTFPVFKEIGAARKRGETFLALHTEGELQKEMYRELRRFGDKKQFEKLLADGFQFPSSQISHFVFGSKVSLLFITYEPVPEAHGIFKRFGKVFEQTYTRFLDLQKAEAQAREAKIEAALEKVRATSLAMHYSDELEKVVVILFDKLIELGLSFDGVLIFQFDKVKRNIQNWVATRYMSVPVKGDLPYEKDMANNQIIRDLWNAVEKGEDVINKSYSGKEKNNYFHYIGKHNESRIPQYIRDFQLHAESWTISFAAEKNSVIGLDCWSGLVTTNEEFQVLKRFARVFEQAYVRFLDLQKAELQAREAQIEAALEKVRSHSLAMHHSNELEQVVASLFDRLVELGLSFDGALIFVFEKQKRNIQLWVATVQLPAPVKIDLPFDEEIKTNAIIKDLWNAVEKGEHIFNKSYSGETKNNYFRYVQKYNESKIPELVRRLQLEKESWTAYFVTEKNSIIGFDSWSGPITSIADEDFRVLKRFAKVFEQAYVRFLDLQKAEAQAREAQIEAALEKVRSRSLAMHHSDELEQVVVSLFDRLVELGLSFDGVGIYLFEREKRNIQLWIATKHLSAPGKVDLPYDKEIETNEIFIDLWNVIETGGSVFNKSYSGETKNQYFRYVAKHNAATVPKAITQFQMDSESWTAYYVAEKNSIIGFDSWSGPIVSFTNKNFEVLKRFAKVFDQAYVRFLDLQRAEAAAQEAQIEAALERVRSRTLAMQKSDELADAASVLFKQLISLGIEPNRLYITIIKDDNGEAEFWITDEDGSKVSAAYTSNLHDNPTFLKMYEGWKQQKKSLVIDIQGEELQSYLHHLGSLHVPFKDGLIQKRRIQYLAYFSSGFIGMASPDEQPHETMQLLERFAYVFNLTFTRFNDLKIAEAHALQAAQDLIAIKAEKKKAEDALTELKAAQAQLIQSEKMASLGQLTAGIAHEIQNPLNFVNNFSEVNTELIDEMEEEINKGNVKEAIAMVKDLKENEQKIMYHGKRADSIVKGMLQHSRASTGKKEQIDINALVDECVRLSYHGMRAKDKEFNVSVNTDFDGRIGRINIVPQDISRMLINLLNNAFYAADQKKKEALALKREYYQPLVRITTKHTCSPSGQGGIEMQVQDNGNGIPQNIIDKIFQPFFTTKPTGQGTGLGLSLSYDIIKAHGGEIQVESKEGEGAIFIIQLPAI